MTEEIFSTDFPTIAGAVDTTANGGSDAFVARLSDCSNGVLDSGEQCDDGNFIDGDGCSATVSGRTLPSCASAAHFGYSLRVRD